MSESVNRLYELASDRLRIGELEAALRTSEAEKRDLKDKYEREQEENKGLRLTLALRTDCEHELERVRNETHPGVEELGRKLACAEKEIALMESTNKELLSALNNTRGQLGKMLRERNEKIREVEQLEEALEKMELAQKSTKRDHLTYDFDMNNYNSNMTILLDELHDQTARYEAESLQMVKKHEEIESNLRKENEKLKAQKEDIVNHSKNSEKMWIERFEQISADLSRLQSLQRTLGTLTDGALIAEHEAKAYELSRKLKDALDAIEEVEDENGDLREKLVEANGRITELETEYSFQKHLFETEQDTAFEDARKHDDHVARLNEELAELEKTRDSLRRDIVAITEKQTQQTISFSNEKAKFCHDMERMEEKWHDEFEKLHKQNEELEEKMFACKKESMDKKEAFVEEMLEKNQKIEDLESLLKVQTATSEREISKLNTNIEELAEELKTVKSKQVTSVKEWDSECQDLEDEIYSLINKRKTECKKLRTMTKKNEWLTKSLKRLSEQRRSELEAKRLEIVKLQKLGQLHEEEKKKWIESLRKTAQRYTDESSLKEEMEKQVEKLMQQNSRLEEQVENVTSNWRRECLAYEDNVATIQQSRIMERERTKKKIEALEDTESMMFARIETLTNANVQYKKALEAQAAEASELQKATVELSKMELDNLRALMDMEKDKILNEKAVIIKNLEKRVKVLNDRIAENEQQLIDANVSIARWQNETEALEESREMDRAMWKDRINQLKETNQQLTENMGVEVLKDESGSSSDDSDDSDSSDDSDCSDGSDCSDSDEDEEVPRPKDEVVTEKEAQEWELVDEDDE